MKLKLDLHPIFNDTQKIEVSLEQIIQDALDKRATEIEIIPGKGSGALKKSVLRYLDRPDVKAKYHRIEKDGENWGRLFVHFRHASVYGAAQAAPSPKDEVAEYSCFCCEATLRLLYDSDDLAEARKLERIEECPSCGSPNMVTIKLTRTDKVLADAVSGYEAS